MVFLGHGSECFPQPVGFAALMFPAGLDAGRHVAVCSCRKGSNRSASTGFSWKSARAAFGRWTPSEPRLRPKSAKRTAGDFRRFARIQFFPPLGHADKAGQRVLKFFNALFLIIGRLLNAAPHVGLNDQHAGFFMAALAALFWPDIGERALPTIRSSPRICSSILF